MIPNCDGRTDRQTDGRTESITANTALCIASCADALQKWRLIDWLMIIITYIVLRYMNGCWFSTGNQITTSGIWLHQLEHDTVQTTLIETRQKLKLSDTPPPIRHYTHKCVHHEMTAETTLWLYTVTYSRGSLQLNKPTTKDRTIHWRQPRRGCRGHIPSNILVGGDVNGNIPTNIITYVRI